MRNYVGYIILKTRKGCLLDEGGRIYKTAKKAKKAANALLDRDILMDRVEVKEIYVDPFPGTNMASVYTAYDSRVKATPTESEA